MESKRDRSGKKWIRKCKGKEKSGSNGANGITPEVMKAKRRERKRAAYRKKERKKENL